MKNKRMRQVTEWAVIFVAAIVMWFFVISDDNPLVEKKIDVPLQYKNVGDGLTVVDHKDGITITVRATRDRISNIRNADFDAFVDLKGMHEGNHSLRANIVAPEKVEVIDDGGEQNVRLEQTVEKQVLLELRRINENEKSYLIKDIIMPDFITIKGAKENVYSVAKAVAQVELEKITASTTYDITPKLFTAAGDAVTDGVLINPPKVAVIVNMYEEKEVTLIPDVGGGVGNYSVVLTPARIKIFGNNEDLAKINSISTVRINVNELMNGRRIACKLLIPGTVRTVANVSEVYCSLKGNG
ncbi:MAG: CdaR family protein [Negativicutes bacterium]|jgi:YbbR domain-containing protein